MTLGARLLLGAGGLLVVSACDADFRFDEGSGARALVDGSASRDASSAPSCTSDGSCRAKGLHCAVDSGVCYACLTDVDCASDTTGSTHCDRSSNRCVACVQNGDCAAGYVCEGTSHQCLASCHDMDDVGRCQPSGATCDVARRVCVTCRGNADCTTSPTGRLCDTTVGRCVACVDDSICTAARPHCDPITGACQACVGPKDCPPSAPACDPGSYTCFAP